MKKQEKMDGIVVDYKETKDDLLLLVEFNNGERKWISIQDVEFQDFFKKFFRNEM